MHFGHPRTTTAFKNRNFLKIWVFQGFPYTRLGHFGFILGLKISKSLQKMAKEWWKIEKKFRNFSKIFETPPECILGILEPSQPSKIEILSKIGFFQDFPYSGFGLFGVNFDSKISKSLQKMAKKWWKNEKIWGICQKYSKLPQNAFWAS